MADLSTTPSVSEIRAAYIANANYDLSTGSLHMAEQFVAACRMLALVSPAEMAKGGESLRLNPQQIEANMNRAISWIAANATSGAGSRAPRQQTSVGFSR